MCVCVCVTFCIYRVHYTWSVQQVLRIHSIKYKIMQSKIVCAALRHNIQQYRHYSGYTVCRTVLWILLQLTTLDANAIIHISSTLHWVDEEHSTRNRNRHLSHSGGVAAPVTQPKHPDPPLSTPNHVFILNRALGLHSMSNRAHWHTLSRLKRGRDIDPGLYLS